MAKAKKVSLNNVSWEKGDLTKALRGSDSVYEVAGKMGLSSSGGNAETIKKYVRALGLPYTIRQGGAIRAR